ncbi:hypothetical protein EH228_06885 [Erwinia endophytica]|uniref:hypothetical protein n=1 Tax=Erwinia endophytica TaxID=1563158 RepID=UPI00126601C8|nr:hypothetical protein [Erwinia endophytica]KAB8312513.1 hypothetical protein EH228_06885 [Erwinia endophytica]
MTTPTRHMNLISLQIQEPAGLPLRFQPGWHNVWEASLHKQSLRRTRASDWLFRRFGSDTPLAPRKTHLRDNMQAFSDTCHLALQRPLARQCLRQKGSKNALIYFDSWGESSLFEDIDNWRDSLFADILPKKIAYTYALQTFSGKLRGERNGFLLALQMAQDCLHSGVADNVVICGQHRHFPVLTMSEALTWSPSPAFTQRNNGALIAVERNLCMLVSKPTDTLPTLFLHPRITLPAGNKASVAFMAERWRHAAGMPIYSSSPPMSALQTRLQRAAESSQAAHVSLFARYGDSGSLNPALGLSHWYNNGAPQSAGLVSCLHSEKHWWLLECQPAGVMPPPHTQDDISVKENIAAL